MPIEMFQIANIPPFLQNAGIYQFILPFLLALAIFYGALKFALGDKIEKSVISLISLILAFFVMLFTSWNVMVVTFFANMGGSALLVATGLLIIIIFLGLFGIKPEKIVGGDKGITKAGWALIVILMFIGVLIFFGAGGGGLVPAAALSSDLQAAIIVIIIIALAMWWMSQEKKEE